MELTVESFLEETLNVSKQENIPQLVVILFNVKHLESSIKSARNIVTEMRVAAPLFEAEIRPLKIEVRGLTRQVVTPEVRKSLSQKAKRLNTLRGLITQVQVDLTNFRKAIKKDREHLAIIIEALREFYRQNPEAEAQLNAAADFGTATVATGAAQA